MILARASVTLSSIRDIESTYRFYKLQASTAAAPAKPTVKAIPPSGWSKTEPAYTEGSTNSLYFVDLTIFTDGSFAYSDVCLSSSYEAAKQAYNKATNAASAASAAQTTANSKNSVFYQASEPSTSGRKTYDVWYDTSDGNKMYYWDGAQWTLKQFGSNAIGENAINETHLVAHSVTATCLATELIMGSGMTINTAEGTLNAGNKLIWDGSTLTVNGKITAGSGSKIGPWNITDTAIYKVSSTMGNASAGASYFGNDGLSITDKFKVSAAGALAATSGKIGKLIITDSYIHSYQNPSSQTAATNMGFAGNQAFWAGNTSSNSAPFRVSYGGALVATNATITGDITATSLTAKNTYSLHNSSGTEAVVLSSADSEFGTTLHLGAGFTDLTVDMDIITLGSVATATVYCGPLYPSLIETRGNITAAGTYNTGNHSVGWASALSGSAAINITDAGATTGFNALAYIKGPSTANWTLGVLNEDGSFRISCGTSANNAQHFMFYQEGYIRTPTGYQTTAPNGFRIVYGNYGFIIRNDGIASYLMTTASGNPWGTWNKYITINNSDCTTTFPSAVTVGGLLTCKNYAGDSRVAVTSVNTDGHRVSVLTTNSANIGVYGQWGTAGTSYIGKTIATTGSDIRLKKNVEDSEIDSLSVLNSIKMRQFDWKDREEHWDIGFVADEIEKIDPKFSMGGGYDENGNMNAKCVNDFYMLGYVVKAIQELSAENKELRRLLKAAAHA